MPSYRETMQQLTADSHARDVAVLDREGIPLTPGDRTGNKSLRAAESELSPEANNAQRRAFVQAAFNRVGEQIGTRPIADAVDTVMRRVEPRFDEVTVRNSTEADQQLIGDLQALHNHYVPSAGLYPDGTAKLVNGVVVRVLDSLQSESLSGHEHQILRSSLRAAAQGTYPKRSAALHAIVEVLDDSMERTIRRTNPIDADEWAKARKDYRNALVLEKWSNSSELTPTTLAEAAGIVCGPKLYVRGLDDFSELAEAAKRVFESRLAQNTMPRSVQLVPAIAQNGNNIVNFRRSQS